MQPLPAAAPQGEQVGKQHCFLPCVAATSRRSLARSSRHGAAVDSASDVTSVGLDGRAQHLSNGLPATKTIPSPARALAGDCLPMMPRYVTVESDLAQWLETSQGILQQRRIDGSLLEHCLDNRLVGHERGLVVEFGVFTANSLRIIASRLPNRKVYGFDSFVGFQEDWEVTGLSVGKEFFGINEKKMAHLSDNVELVKGFFNESLPRFLLEHPEPFSFVHIDCDMYSSTRDVFNLASSRFQTGTVVVFDEFFCHDADCKGEFTAFYEWLKRTEQKFEFLGVGDGSHELMTRFPNLEEPLFIDRLGAALLFNGLKLIRGKNNFATAVAIRIL